MSEWTPEQSLAACREGWDIFSCDDLHHPAFELQRIDSPEDGWVELDDDTDAWDRVRHGAAAGSPLHLAALEFLADNSPVEHQHVVTDTYYGEVPYDPRQDPTAESWQIEAWLDDQPRPDLTII